MELVATLVLGILKWVFQMRSNKKLSNDEFLAHIKAHQDRRSNAGKAAIDFEESMKKAEEEANK
jgi:hypothetical protein